MLRVIGAGFGRTGTMTLKTALGMLGFAPCYHFTEVFAHPEHLPHWAAAADGREPGAWRVPLHGYAATTDWPGVVFWREMSEAFPDAKVILTIRDAAEWYESMRNTVFAAIGGRFPETAERFRAFEAAEHLAAFREAGLIGRSFAGRIDDRDHVIACYERHNDEVRRTVAADRLLVFRVEDGWAPLCAFLGVPVPDRSFPRSNAREDFRSTVLRAPAG
ncbi:sulfotransferase family protein [Sphaerisporangium melleum]|uniref:Sulfotransferase family protein n=1 Tax=Sphaerisporangium melleum TaxID=321316 RepID=A0A917R532_9ACTN|nr:sulfotransferase family protein [Sphaerisporangium melleum]GGK90689.1 sulfotransferase family protein [Sphaerisporangium melleum]GII72832.1 sulfotransferase family protein [Sphaerisporangium melleum]